jgi:type II secretory pathway pseudopilin PulG
MPSRIESAGAVRRSSESGFSLVEGLIAALLLLIIVLGILPLFTRAMANNVQGNDATRVTAATIDAIEGLFGVPFNNQSMTLVVGQPNLTTQDVFSLDLNRWMLLADLGVSDQAQYARATQVQQFNFVDIQTDGTLDTPLAGGTDPNTVHLKLIEIRVQNNRTLGTPPYRVRSIQSY